ncbi:MAG: transporter substrate-binding domain-containing protein [Pseudomonadota bacterium]
MTLKRRTFGHLALGAGMATGLPAGLRPALADDALELLEAGTLSSATEGTFPPFSYAEGSDLKGFELSVIREIAARLGLEHKPVVIAWDSILVGLMSDQYDMVSNPMGITEERQKSVYFCDAWVESGARIAVRADDAAATTDDLKGRSIGAIVASTFVPLAEELTDDVRSYSSDPEALQDVINGNVDGAIVDGIGGAYAIKTGSLPLRLVDGFLDSYQMGWAVAKTRPNLVRAINGALAEMVSDGSFAQLAMDEIGIDPTPREPIRTLFES